MPAFCPTCGATTASGKFCGSCGAKLESPTIGRYTAGRVVGTGWSGRVLEGMDPVLDRRVAIRLLSARVQGDPQVWQAYARSLGRCAGITHPHCVSVYGVIEQPDAATAVVLEFVAGAPLSSLSLAHDPATVVFLADRALSGLAFLHQHQVVHGRVDARHVLVTEDGQSKLADAGLPLLPDQPGGRAILAREQLGGAEPSAPGDVFGFAASLWWSMTGSAPFGEPRDTASAIRARSAPPLGTDALPRQLRDVLIPALDPDPAVRPTAAALRKRLQEAADAATPGWQTRASVAATAVAAGVAAGVVGATVPAAGAVAVGGGAGVAATAGAATVSGGGAASTGLAATLTGKAVATVAAGVVAAAAVTTGAVYVRAQQADETVASPPPAAVQWHVPTVQRARTLGVAEAPQGDLGISLAISPDGQSVIFRETSGSPKVVDTQSRDEQSWLSSSAWFTDQALGSRDVVVSSDSIDETVSTATYSGADAQVVGRGSVATVSADGRKVSYLDTSDELMVVDTADGKPRRVASGCGFNGGLSPSAEAVSCLYDTNGGTSSIVHIQDGRRVVIRRPEVPQIPGMEQDTAVLVLRCQWLDDNTALIGWGRAQAGTDALPQRTVWATVNADTGESTPISDLDDAARALITADGLTAVKTDREGTRLIFLPTGEEQPITTAPIDAMVLSHDGKTLAYAAAPSSTTGPPTVFTRTITYDTQPAAR